MANVLVVDDSEMVRAQLRNDLITEGHTTFEACNGLEALQVLKEDIRKIDLIFCDVNMPEMDGLALCRELHRDTSLSKIPIFMLTTQTSADMKAEGKESGVIAWIVKPYDKKKVMAGVAKVLARSA
jgi:two-component system, chemotaxis family, chemotaxis protein CheY